jgi:hypothetical protein
MASPGSAQLTPATMQTAQLRSLERQLEEENTLLTANFNQLKMAQQKFADAAAVVATLTADKKGACTRCGVAFCPSLPPLTPRHHARTHAQARRSWCP